MASTPTDANRDWTEAERIALLWARWACKRHWPGEFDDWHQEALLAAWEAHCAFRAGGTTYSTWVGCKVRQRLVDALRRLSRQRPRGHRLDVALLAVADHRAPEDGPGAEYRDLVAELGRHLTPAERQQFAVMFGSGHSLTQQETARALGVGQTLVSRRKIAAFERLKLTRSVVCLASA